MSLILFKCSLTLTDTPSSACSHIIENSLKFYSILKYFRTLIDQHDKESLPNCALIVPYQYNESNNVDSNHLIFKFEKHHTPITHAAIYLHENNRYLFTLSEEKLNLFDLQLLKDCGEVNLEILSKRTCKNLIVYMDQQRTEANEINGSFFI